MSRSADRLREYLAADERLTAAHAVSLSEGSAWTDVALGVTDRRLLWVGDGGGTASIDLEHVTAVESRHRTRPTVRGDDRQLALVGGGLFAALCSVGAVALSGSALAPVLALVSVAGLVATTHLWRTLDEVEWAPVAGGATVAVGAFLGVVATAASPLVPLFVLAAIGGLALVDRVRRRESDAEGLEIDYRHEREVSISTADGRAVHVRTDPATTLDRDLGRQAFVERADRLSIAPARS
jgi:hypothetical protein